MFDLLTIFIFYLVFLKILCLHDTTSETGKGRCKYIFVSRGLSYLWLMYSCDYIVFMRASQTRLRENNKHTSNTHRLLDSSFDT